MQHLIQRLVSNWMRNILTMFQIAAAVAVIITVVMNVLPALRTMTGAPDHAIFAVRYEGTTDGTPVSASVFSPDDLDYLMNTAEAVQHATLFESDSTAVIRVGDERYAVSQLAHVSAGFADLTQLDIVAGTFFAESEVGKTTPRVAVISEAAAQSLFGSDSPIGKTINLRPEQEGIIVNMPIVYDPGIVQAVLGAPGSEIKIIGVYKTVDSLVNEGFAPGLLLPAAAQATHHGTMLPGMSSAGNVSVRTSVTDKTYATILVTPKADMVREAEQEVKALLQSRLGGSTALSFFAQRTDDAEFTFSPLDDWSRLVAESQVRQGAVIGVMGMATLIIAGFAVFTTTLVNITQRTRAIGLARAMGATRGHVVREAAAEAALLSFGGAILGTLSAYPMSKFVLTSFQFALRQGGLSATDAVVAVAVAVLLALTVGVGAAFYPAWSTARMMPAEAWREGAGT